MKHGEIINLFGGIRPLARALGHKNATTVQAWAEKGKIPTWRWHEVLKAARAKRLGLSEASFNGAQK